MKKRTLIALAIVVGIGLGGWSCGRQGPLTPHEPQRSVTKVSGQQGEGPQLVEGARSGIGGHGAQVGGPGDDRQDGGDGNDTQIGGGAGTTSNTAGAGMTANSGWKGTTANSGMTGMIPN